ncbi:hypothetical protein [Saccharolobus caldissimus]|uniref:hypothetical protein n=1 Tax=Saccharolobus caldissimus TaxID=1702097 RepID=UPI001E2BF1DD|nr:hypothetical protein [Saccharolobus caldissimus]
MSEETGIKEGFIYHVLEILRYLNLVEKYNNKYYSKYSEVTKLILEIKDTDEYIN